MRHDLKGGLITLKMGLESLSDEQTLKPLLLDKTQELIDLSDKLVLLLRMGELNRQSVNPASLLQHAARQAGELFPELTVVVTSSDDLSRWSVDPDAINYAIMELAQNAGLAGAKNLDILVSESDGEAKVGVLDDGTGFPTDRKLEELMILGQSGWGRPGLGLSVVESCVVQHGGRLTIDKDEKSGRTLVRMEFPFEKRS